MMTESAGLSASGIVLMKQMAGDRLKSQVLVQDSVCMGGLVMVLSNYDPSIVTAALETLLKLAEWPNLRSTLKDFLGMKDQLDTLMMTAGPSIQTIARRVFSLLYSSVSASSEAKLNQSQLSTSCVTRKDAASRRRRNSFFVGAVAKAKTIVLQIRGLNDKDDVDVCRNSLLTVTGVISITFDLKKKRAILRTKPDLHPELLAKAVARTMTMSAEQVVKSDGGSETLVSFNIHDDTEPHVEMPDYPSDVDSPVSGNQNVVRHGTKFTEGGTWGFLQSLGSLISNSLYW